MGVLDLPLAHRAEVQLKRACAEPLSLIQYSGCEQMSGVDLFACEQQASKSSIEINAEANISERFLKFTDILFLTYFILGFTVEFY